MSVTSDRYKRLCSVVAAVLEAPESERQSALEQLCKGDEDLRKEALGYLHDAPSLTTLLAGFVCRGLDEDDAAPGQGDPGTIGPYRVIREIGRGGQGRVLLAEDPRLDRKVAIKVLHASGSAEQAMRRFDREAILASRVEEPGICPIYDYGVHEGAPYIVMRHIEGRSLASLVAEGSIVPRDRAGIDRVVRLVERTARALQHAHAGGIVHRDIKPGNIMVTADDQPVIMDFGLAHAEADGTPSLTETGAVFGTLKYMPPERFQGRGIRDPRGDVWALGVTLYECLLGRRPFEGATEAAIMRSVTAEEPTDPRRHNPRISRDLAIVVRTALAKRVEDRYQSAAALADDLERVSSGRSILARPIPAPVRCARWAGRNPALASSVFAAFFLLLLALILSQRFASERQELLQQTQLERDTAITLSDLRGLPELLAEGDRLWPAAPATVPRIDEWLAQAEAWLERQRGALEELESVRSRALPLSENDPRAEAALRASAPGLFSDMDRSLSDQRVWRALKRHGRPVDLAEAEAAHDRRMRHLREQVAALPRAYYDFEDPADRAAHERVATIARGWHELHDLVEEIRKRRRRALSLHAETIEAFQEPWTACLKDLRRHPEIGDLELEPVPGLVPLGVNAHSGFWEFWHVPSGPRPVWNERGVKTGPTYDAGIVLVLLPGGKTRVGASTSEGDPHFDRMARSQEELSLEVRLDPFFISKFEVTQAQWMRVMPENPSGYQQTIWFDLGGPAHPVESTSRSMAAECARRLGLELPTESQWEYAARGGTKTPWWTGRRPESLLRKENFGGVEIAGQWVAPSASGGGEGDAWKIHAPVGSAAPNPFGLHDVLGNVSEWCLDNFATLRWELRDGDGVQLIPGGSMGVARGGSFGRDPFFCRVTHRSNYVLLPERRIEDAGLRPVLNLRRH